MKKTIFLLLIIGVLFIFNIIKVEKVEADLVAYEFGYDCEEVIKVGQMVRCDFYIDINTSINDIEVKEFYLRFTDRCFWNNECKDLYFIGFLPKEGWSNNISDSPNAVMTENEKGAKGRIELGSLDFEINKLKESYSLDFIYSLEYIDTEDDATQENIVINIDPDVIIPEEKEEDNKDIPLFLIVGIPVVLIVITVTTLTIRRKKKLNNNK